MVNAEQIKKLRDKTGASISAVKNALEEAGGDEQEALEVLVAMSGAIARKKAEREIKQGLVESYIHANGKIGVLLVLGCETDFVAKNEQFKVLAKEISMQIAAAGPEDETTLLNQSYIRDPQKTIQELINEHIAKFGENIKIGQFARFAI